MPDLKHVREKTREKEIATRRGADGKLTITP
jgi:hypothetical protein